MILKNCKAILLIFTLLLFSWILVHLFALFGIFLAVTYPIWWLLVPKYNFCFVCRAKKDGSLCYFCRHQVPKTHGVHAPILSSALLNSIVIFIFSLLSISIVFGESKLLFALGISSVPKTATFVIPNRGQYKLGEIFPMKLEITNIKTPINAVQVDIGFDSSKLEIATISTKDSFANVFLQKEINNNAGYARLTGGLPNPGFFADRGTFGTVYFRGKTSGLMQVSFLSTSLVLANDGSGSNILKDFPVVSYLILPEKINQQEEALQKSMLLGASVLGASTSRTKQKQITFFEESNVLGASVQSMKKLPQEKTNIVFMALTTLSKIDTFIFSLWGKVLHRN